MPQLRKLWSWETALARRRRTHDCDRSSSRLEGCMTASSTATIDLFSLPRSLANLLSCRTGLCLALSPARWLPVPARAQRNQMPPSENLWSLSPFKKTEDESARLSFGQKARHHLAHEPHMLPCYQHRSLTKLRRWRRVQRQVQICILLQELGLVFRCLQTRLVL